MKQKMMVLLMTLFVAMPSLARLGQEGHGGDLVVSEFLILAEEIIESLKTVDTALLPAEDFVKLFSEAVEKTEVTSSEKVTLGDVEVDAINFPDADSPEIIIGRNRWLDDRVPTRLRKRLIIHEYLSIIGFDDRHYRLSYRINKLISIPESEALPGIDD